MTLLFLCSLGLVSAYALMMLALALALTSDAPPARRPANEQPASGMTVILPFRNEERVLDATLHALAAQDLETDQWELLAVDDGSCDQSVTRIRTWIDSHDPPFRLRLHHTSAEAPGKKAAIELAAAAATHPLCVVLDADSCPGPSWLRRMRDAFDADTGLVAGAVIFSGSGLWASLVRLEYAAILAAGLASFRLGRPLFASGANLAWRLRAFRDAKGYAGALHLPSADDTILLQRMATRTSWRLKTCLCEEAVVTSRGPASIRAFWQQRVRWTSTELEMPDRWGRVAAFAVYAVYPLNLMILLAWGVGSLPAWPWILLPLMKLLADFALMLRAARVFRLCGEVWLSPIVWFLQLIYGSLVPWFGQFGRYRWREAP